MPDTWVTDLKHFLNANGSIAPPSGPARKLAEHFAAIVTELSAELAEIDGVEKVACRRRPASGDQVQRIYYAACPVTRSAA